MGHDLTRIESELDRKKMRISALKSELSDLEAEVPRLEDAIRTLMRVLGQENGTEDSCAVRIGSQDLSGKTIRECIVMILEESDPQWLSPREIMRHAINRGYTNTNGSTPITVRNSFLKILNRYPNVFVKNGKGYRLAVRVNTNADKNSETFPD